MLMLCNTYGASDSGVAWVADTFYADAVNSPSNASARCNIQTSGEITNHGGADTGNWKLPSSAGAGNGYQVRFTQISGDPLVGSSLNTWLNLSSTRSIGIDRNSIGSASATCRVEIRNKNTTLIRITQDIDFIVEVFAEL